MAVLSKSEIEHKAMSGAIAALSMDAVQKANSGHPGIANGYGRCCDRSVLEVFEV